MRSIWRGFAPATPPVGGSPARFESLEKRQLLSRTVGGICANELIDGNTGGADLTQPLAAARVQTILAVAATPALTNIKRVYLGLTGGAKAKQSALIFKIRKQDSRGSIRGEVRLATSNLSILTAQITSGKITARRAVTMKFSGTGFSGTITGKANISGSQIKGTYTAKGTAFKGSGAFSVKKYIA